MRGIRLSILISVALLALFRPALAVPGELKGLAEQMQQEALVKISAETGADAALRQEAAQKLESYILKSFNASRELNSADAEASLLSLKEVLSKDFAKLSAVDIAQCYAEAKGNYDSFAVNFRKLAQEHKINLSETEWKSAAIVSELHKIHKKLVLLDSMYITAAASGHYVKDGWIGDVRVTWYPLKGMVYLFSVVSVSDQSGINNVVMNLTGQVSSQQNKRRMVKQVALTSNKFEVGVRKSLFFGEWTLPSEPVPGTQDKLFVNGRIRLYIIGKKVEGVASEDIVGTVGGHKISGTIEYSIQGTISDKGAILGSCKVSGPAEIIEARNGKPVTICAISGFNSGKKAQGTIKLGADCTINWSADAKKR